MLGEEGELCSWEKKSPCELPGGGKNVTMLVATLEEKSHCES